MNKKIILATIILILIVTGLVFFLKYKGIIFSPPPKPSGIQATPEKEKTQAVKIESVGATGTVKSVNDQELVLLVDSKEITLDIANPPQIYMLSGQTRVDKKITDLQSGSVIEVRYLDNTVKKMPLVIRIDKL
jgi:hypothetical protein